jgi:hemerythrin superfamily protein
MTNLSYQQLVDDHDKIEAIADTILDMTRATPPDPVAIATRLTELAIVVADHLGQEDALLYPRLVRADDGKERRIGEQFDLLKVDWMEYLREWPLEAITADNATFAAETAEILVRLKSRVRLESDLLYSSALRNGRISLR